MYVAMLKSPEGRSGVPERFWNKAIAENLDEVASLKTKGYVLSVNQPNDRSEALAWLNR
jgi:hypothetical protein